MKITINYNGNVKVIENKSYVTIGSSSESDYVIEGLKEDEVVKLIYAEKYNNYILVNSENSKGVYFNGKPFSKILVPSNFTVTTESTNIPIEFAVETMVVPATKTKVSKSKKEKETSGTIDDIFDCDIERNRVAIIKEIGYKIIDLNNNVKTSTIINYILTAAIVILSAISSFGITNYLLGFKIDNTSSAINLTTNFWFLAGITSIIMAVSFTLKYAVSSLITVNTNKKFGTSDFAQKFIITVTSMFIFIVYILNLSYYKPISGFSALFISLLFVGGLSIVTIGSGYYNSQIKLCRQHLYSYDYREDFESVLKSYRLLISKYINNLSPNKINSVKDNLLNNQLKMVVECIVGFLTAPFLAYGVSNTLASCFPEAANWVRISGLRFSPVFLVLSTFLIVFAFISFVRAFAIGKQIKGSETIKFDGFHNYSNHGVTILGRDSIRNLEKEKAFVMFVACFIIFIEFTMNVSYFVTEIGGNIQGMFLSIITALVPTALLIAETSMLGGTMNKIHNYSDLLDKLD